jgi:hypothetical protein
VNAVSPGPIKTPIYTKLGIPETQVEQFAGKLQQVIPMPFGCTWQRRQNGYFQPIPNSVGKVCSYSSFRLDRSHVWTESTFQPICTGEAELCGGTVSKGERSPNSCIGGVTDRTRVFLDDYSIVNVAHFSWLWCSTHQEFSIESYPNLRAWFDLISARSAVQKGVIVPLPLPDFTPFQAVTHRS